jgi:hypothetical protein
MLNGVNIIMATLPKGLKNCATCALWAGPRTPKFGGIVEVDRHAKGKCCGGGFNNVQIEAMCNCNKWELWPAVRK